MKSFGYNILNFAYTDVTNKYLCCIRQRCNHRQCSSRRRRIADDVIAILSIYRVLLLKSNIDRFYRRLHSDWIKKKKKLQL